MIYFRVQREEGTKRQRQPLVMMLACMPVPSLLALAHAHAACQPVLSPLALAPPRSLLSCGGGTAASFPPRIITGRAEDDAEAYTRTVPGGALARPHLGSMSPHPLQRILFGGYKNRIWCSPFTAHRKPDSCGPLLQFPAEWTRRRRASTPHPVAGYPTPLAAWSV